MKYFVEIVIRDHTGEVQDFTITHHTDSITDARNRMYTLDEHSEEITAAENEQE